VGRRYDLGPSRGRDRAHPPDRRRVWPDGWSRVEIDELAVRLVKVVDHLLLQPPARLRDNIARVLCEAAKATPGGGAKVNEIGDSSLTSQSSSIACLFNGRRSSSSV
jgi:hypothetical protein